ncbi:MOSMO protein, partial [Polypterus senegalus]
MRAARGGQCSDLKNGVACAYLCSLNTERATPVRITFRSLVTRAIALVGREVQMTKHNKSKACTWICQIRSDFFGCALTVGLVRQCQTIHGRDRTCIPPRLPPEWVTTLFFIIMGIISLTVTCGLLVASHWRREATKYARWIAFTGSLSCSPAELQRQLDHIDLRRSPPLRVAAPPISALLLSSYPPPPR